MTDRHSGYIVTLEADIREDDGEATLNAIRQIKGVISVDPVVADISQHMADTRARMAIGERLWEVLKP